MSSKIWGAFAVLTLVVACGSDDSSGSGGSSGKGGSDAGKGGTGGTSSGGTSSGGTGGTGTGGAGTGGTGVGGANGGTAGAGGGQAGQGGSAGQIVKDVPCDNGAACPIAPGHCCFTGGSSASDAGTSDAGGDAATGSAICQGDNGQCGGTTISCNNKKDCNGLNVCCLKVTLATGAGEAKCVKPSDCKDTTGGDGGVTVQATQLCDPALTTPTECLAGSCQTYTGSALPSGYDGCKP